MKKVKKNERKESKGAPEKSEAEKRRDRRLARKARAEKSADASEGHNRDRKEVPGRGDSTPDVAASTVPGVEERFKIALTTDNLIKAVGPLDQPKVEFCDKHHDLLLHKINVHKMGHLVTTNEKQLGDRLRAKGIEPVYHASEALIKLAITMVGSEGVVQHRCPICAIKKFDFLGQVVTGVKTALMERARLSSQSTRN